VEIAIRAEVHSGLFASEDDLLAAAVRDYLSRQRQAVPQQSDAGPKTPSPDHKSIWEVIEEEIRSMPPEVWDALPIDLSEQLDHYIYGAPKQPLR